MPRKTSDERHLTTQPPAAGPGLVDAVAAYAHPTRAKLYDLLVAHGPTPVGRLARLAGIAPGSVSHHLGVLHRTGWVVPVPDQARDTRESCWRACSRQIGWTGEEYEAGTGGRTVLDLAARNQALREHEATMRWLQARAEGADEWGGSASASAYVLATAEQTEDLAERVQELVDTWVRECRTDREARPGEERRPVRVIARVFPEEGKP